MNRAALPSTQRGVTLVVGLIMLVLITLIVAAAFMMSSTNLRSVGNMQYRDEAVAAGNSAIEQRLTDLTTAGGFNSPPGSATVTVDINRDNKDDFNVAISAPTCTQEKAITAPPPAGTGNSVTTGILPPVIFYNTLWDFTATVTEASGVASTGATVTMHQGMRVKLNQLQCDQACGPAMVPATTHCS
jgi:FlaG/FlaF family flagellin (archaellin)